VRIGVLVKEVPDVTVRRRIDPDTGRLDRGGEGRLNPYDAHAVEAAVALRERGEVPVEEIVAVTMGPASAARVIQQALSRGADRAIHLSDPLLAGSDLNGTAHALACVLAPESFDLVLLGQQAADGECYAMVAAIGEHLELPALSQVIELRVAGGAVECRRQGEYGYDRVRVALPAVISVAEGINEPRYPSLKAIMGARGKRVDQLTAADAEADPARVGHANARALCARFTPPPPRPPARVLDGADPDATVREILDWLEERRLLA
jgi:electron transfer flavoprotein beta subunit